ncbi:hypothetical protein Tco_1300539 [Tanacetum coccineum]
MTRYPQTVGNCLDTLPLSAYQLFPQTNTPSYSLIFFLFLSLHLNVWSATISGEWELVVHGLIFSGKVVIDEDIGTKCERSDGDEYRVEVRWILQRVIKLLSLSRVWFQLSRKSLRALGVLETQKLN